MSAFQRIPISNQYVDIMISNNTVDALQASYSVDLTSPVIDKNSNGWDVGITRLKYCSNLIPLSERFLDTDFSLSLSVGFSDANSFTAFMLNSYIPNGSEYIWFYSEWIQAFTSACEECAFQLYVGNPGIYPVIGGGTKQEYLDVYGAPFLNLGQSGGIMTLYYPISYQANNIYFWMNTRLADKIPFPNILATTSYANRIYLPPSLIGITPPNNYLITIDYFSRDSTDFYFTTVQDNASLALLNSLDSVVVKTTLSVNSEISLINNDGIQQQQQVYNNILTDFEVQFGSNGRDLNGYDFYANQNTRRYQLVNNEPISKISVQLFWRSSKGILYPLFIPYLSNINMKIEFRKIADGRYITNN